MRVAVSAVVSPHYSEDENEYILGIHLQEFQIMPTFESPEGYKEFFKDLMGQEAIIEKLVAKKIFQGAFEFVDTQSISTRIRIIADKSINISEKRLLFLRFTRSKP